MNKSKLIAKLLIIITLGFSISSCLPIITYDLSLTTCFSDLDRADVWGWLVMDTPIQLTYNGLDDYQPKIHNGMVTWTQYDGNEYEVLFYDGTNTFQLTDNEVRDRARNPEIHNGMVTWWATDGNDYEIFLYDGTSTQQLTDNEGDDFFPKIHNGMVTWTANDGNDNEIFLYDGISTHQLTNNEESDHYPQIHNGMVTWERYDGNDQEILFYDGTNTYQLTDNEVFDNNPKIHNGMVTWWAYDGNDREIFLYDGTSTHQLSNNEEEDSNPQIHSGMVTWRGYDGNDYEIFLYDGTSTKQLSNNEETDLYPQIHNGIVTWAYDDGNDYEIFFYNGDFTQQVTNNEEDDTNPQIHDDMLTWKGFDGHDSEIFIAYPITSRLQLELSGSFDFLENEDIQFQIAGLLTDLDTGKPISGATVTFGVYDPDGNLLHQGYLVEEVAYTGVYIKKFQETMKEMDFPEGVYWIYTKAVTSEGLKAVDMIQLHIEPEARRLHLKLSGSFDFLEKEDVQLQIAALLTDFFTGDPISGAMVTFGVYDPDGNLLYQGYLVEEVAYTGVYIKKLQETIKEQKLPKGIYWIYAKAETSEGLRAVDMIQFHIDPPGDEESNPWLTLTLVGFGVVALMGIVMVFMWRHYRRFTR
jgi:hypothetical protein